MPERIGDTMDKVNEKAGSAFIYSPKFSQFKPPRDFPWSVLRTEKMYEACRRLNLLDHPWISVHEPAPAKEEAILSFHDKAYIGRLKKANKGVPDEAWLRYGIGTTECPVFKGVYDYHALAAGATLSGVDLLHRGEAQLVFNPTGGFHHAGRDFAAGFCYINDIVLAAKKFLDLKQRVLYVDIDAHHGDQVQEAFYGSSRVLTLSFHESGKTLFPFKTGFEIEMGKGRGKGYAVNFPLPEKTGDEEFMWAFKRIFLPLAEAFKPDVVIAALGADALFSDPMTHLSLTNLAFSRAVQMIADHAPKLLALGCGGYSHEDAVRTWTLEWAILNDLGCSDDEIATFGGGFWGDGICSLQDSSFFIPENIRDDNMKEIRRITRAIQKNIFPIHGIENAKA